MFDPTEGPCATGTGGGLAEVALDEGAQAAQAAGEYTLAAGTTVLQPLQPVGTVGTVFLRKNAVSGRYRSSGGYWILEVRVDVDRTRPMNKVSGDFFQVSGATTSYYGSFLVSAPTVSVTADTVTVEGLGTFTWANSYNKVRVTIPRTSIFSAQAAATVLFLTPAGAAGTTYTCPFVSPYFRTVLWEQDSVTGAVPFVTYNTGSLPQPPESPARDLTVSKAYAEAGIEMLASGTPNVFNASAFTGADSLWDDSELHAAMVANFSLWANVPQWKVYLLVASAHRDGYRGIMFDYADAFQRQGCAVFYNAIQGADAASQRAQLRTYVHELGHCFNLLHSWQKNLASPPAPLGPNSGYGDLSWMNYAWKYQPPPPDPGGEAAYWSKFAFQFTPNEVVHLRHALYRNIILGGNAFGTGAADVDPEVFADRPADASGLALELRSKPIYALGEPVVVEIKLATTDLRGREVHTYLHPKATMVQVAIQTPGGRTVLYRPMIDHCADESRTARLDASRPAVYESAYIGYGKDGFYFEQPGVYRLRALYLAPDGSQVVSPTLRLRVTPPFAAADAEVAELLMGDEQGQLLTLLGSDAAALRRGNDALDLLLEKYAKHPLAVYARLVKGMNAQRDFKRFDARSGASVRKADPAASVGQLSSVVEASTADGGVDNITLGMVMKHLAHAHRKAGDSRKAAAALDRMNGVFKQKGLRPVILEGIAAEVAAEKALLKAT